jgi:hypothetical protein
MAKYPIFTQEGSTQRIAINPERVVSLIELEPKRTIINMPDGGGVTVAMRLESVIALLAGGRDLSPEGS